MRPLRAASVLWAGGGAAGTTTRLRRARHRLRTKMSEHPGIYLPFARRKYPGPSPMVIGAGTEAVIDGYTRSASTFAVYAFQLAQPKPVRLAHHLHAPAQLIQAAKAGLPTLMVIRDPEGAVLSQVVREPDVDLLDALYSYRRFHESLMPYRAAFLIADFRDVTSDFGSVVRRLNEKFGTTYGVFEGTPEAVAECTRFVEQRPTLCPILLGFESGHVNVAQARRFVEETAQPSTAEAVWVPSAARDDAKAALRSSWSAPALSRARGRAERAYERFLGEHTASKTQKN